LSLAGLATSVGSESISSPSFVDSTRITSSCELWPNSTVCGRPCRPSTRLMCRAARGITSAKSTSHVEFPRLYSPNCRSVAGMAAEDIHTCQRVASYTIHSTHTRPRARASPHRQPGPTAASCPRRGPGTRYPPRRTDLPPRHRLPSATAHDGHSECMSSVGCTAAATVAAVVPDYAPAADSPAGTSAAEYSARRTISLVSTSARSCTIRRGGGPALLLGLPLLLLLLLLPPPAAGCCTSAPLTGAVGSAVAAIAPLAPHPNVVGPFCGATPVSGRGSLAS
jgi:hypothetical protein